MLFNNIYTWNVVEQNRLNKESIAPFQRSDVRVFADLFWSLQLVPLDFQRWVWKSPLELRDFAHIPPSIVYWIEDLIRGWLQKSQDKPY